MFTKKLALGLDIGRDSIKVAVVEPDKGTVVDLWTTDILPGRQRRDEEADQDHLATMLRELLEQAGGKRCRAMASAVQGVGTLYGYLELPRMAPAELAVAVPAAVRNRHPFLKEGLSISYTVVPCVQPDPTRCAVFYVAAPKGAVEGLSDQLKQTRLKLARVEATPLALVREFSRNHPSATGFTALVHTGFELTHVVLVRSGHPYYARDFALAGRDFTYAVQMNRQSSWSDAERLKRNLDAMGRDTALEPYVTAWLKEVERTLLSARSQLKSDVHRIILSGRGAQWAGLDQRLAEHLDTRVRPDHWEDLRVPSQSGAGLEYRVAVGLALGA